MQPVFDALWGSDGGMYERRLGRSRMRAMNRFAAVRAAGMPLAFGSDAPVTPLGPRPAIRAATEHHRSDQRLGQEDARIAHSVAGWRAVGIDDAGTITVGAPAHLAIWAPDAADDAPALRTLVHGRTVHDTGVLP